MSYKQGGPGITLAVSGGYAEVLNNVMTVLATAAEFLVRNRHATRARQAKESAEKRMGRA